MHDKRAWKTLQIVIAEQRVSELPTVSSVSAADVAYAQKAGYLFDDIMLGHDDVVQWLIESRRRVTLRQAADAFVASLSSRRLDWRSALGSFSFAAHFPEHGIAECRPNERCFVCGGWDIDANNRYRGLHEANWFSLERHKYGGVRHRNPAFSAFDLGLFANASKPKPTAKDFAILRSILHAAAEAPAAARANDLEKRLAGLFVSNSNERRIVIEVLSMAGVLSVQGRPGFLQAFTTAEKTNADRPPDHKNDWQYPAIWWRGGETGVNWNVAHACFPQLG